ncbi:MAG: DUF3237 family protein [Gaiellaceae bacterium]
MSLEHLFDAELRHHPGTEPLLSAAEGDGELIGSGDGTVTGPRLAGNLHWTLFEHPGELVCAMNPVAVIETEDGAQVRLEARGYAQRRSADERIWRVAATLRFESDDERYRWLGQRLGIWEGQFDADAARASYRAYVQTEGRETE